MLIKFSVEIVRLKGLCIILSLALHSRSQLCIKLDRCFTCTRIAISRTVFKLWHAFILGMNVDLCMAYMLMLVSMILTLMQSHSGSAKYKIQCWIISTTKQAIIIIPATMVGHLLRDLDFENVYTAGPTCFFLFFFPSVCHYFPRETKIVLFKRRWASRGYRLMFEHSLSSTKGRGRCDGQENKCGGFPFERQCTLLRPCAVPWPRFVTH